MGRSRAVSSPMHAFPDWSRFGPTVVSGRVGGMALLHERCALHTGISALSAADGYDSAQSAGRYSSGHQWHNLSYETLAIASHSWFIPSSINPLWIDETPSRKYVSPVFVSEKHGANCSIMTPFSNAAPAIALALRRGSSQLRTKLVPPYSPYFSKCGSLSRRTELASRQRCS